MFTRNVGKRILPLLVCFAFLLTLNMSLQAGATSGSSGNLVLGKAGSDLSASSVFDVNVATNAVDGNMDTRWAIGPTETTGTLTINFGVATTFSNAIISDYNSAVTAFTIEYYNGTAWAFAYKGGTTIGANKAVAFTAAATGTKLRLNITTLGGGGITEFEVFNGTANKSTITVTSTLKGKSPKYIGLSAGNFREDSNVGGWIKYSRSNTLREWVATTNYIEDEDFSNDPVNILNVADLDARKALFRIDPDSSTNINWANIAVALDDMTANRAMAFNKANGITSLTSITYRRFSPTGTWQEYWNCWKYSYAAAFYFAKNFDANVFQAMNEPEFYVPSDFSVATYVKSIQVQSDAVRCAVEDVNRIFGKNLVAQYVAPVLASSSLNTLPVETMKGNRTDYHGNSINYNITDWFDRHKYSTSYDSYPGEIAQINTMVSTNTPNHTTLPISISEWNWHTQGDWDSAANSVYDSDSTNVFSIVGNTLATTMASNVYAMYLFKGWATKYKASNIISYTWTTDRDETLNIIKGKPITASSAQVGYSGDKAVDGDIRDESSWRTPSNSVGPQTLEVDLQNTYSIKFASVHLGKLGGDGLSSVPSDISLQYFDGVNWVNILANANNTSAGGNFLSATLSTAVTTNKIRCLSTISGTLVVREIYVSEEPPTQYFGGPMKSFEVNRLFATGFVDQRDLYTTTSTDSSIDTATSYDPVSNNYYMWIVQPNNTTDLYTSINLSGLDVCKGTVVNVREVSAQHFGEVPYIVKIDTNKTVKVNIPKRCAILVTIPKGQTVLNSTDLTPIEDTMVSIGTNANTNYSTNPDGVWTVRQSTFTQSDNKVTYMKFNTGTINTAKIQRAVLEVRGTKVSTNLTTPFTIYAFGLDNDSWSASNLTGNNAPNLNKNCAFIQDGGVTSWPIGQLSFKGSADFSRIDVTDYVKNHPNSLVTIAFVKDKRSEQEINDADSVTINTSTDSDVNSRPKLKLWYTEDVLPYVLSNFKYTPNAGVGVLTADLKNNTTETKAVNMIYAAYKDNKLVGIKISAQTLNASQSKALMYPVPITVGTAWDTIKAFVIDTTLTTIKPITPNAVLVS